MCAGTWVDYRPALTARQHLFASFCGNLRKALTESSMGDMDTFGEVIEAAGGPAGVANICHVHRSTPAQWARRGSIPPEHWRALRAHLAGRGVWLDWADLVVLAERAARERAA